MSIVNLDMREFSFLLYPPIGGYKLLWKKRLLDSGITRLKYICS
jgi:hypothetical protein